MANPAPDTAEHPADELPAVIMCTWQGAAHLSAQLDSLAKQSRTARVYIHDDASTDDTTAIAQQHPVCTRVVAHTQNQGVVANFERALHDMLSSGYQHIALADQDDVWHADRLERGLAEMQRLEAEHGPQTPLLVHSDLRMVDEAGKELAPSFLKFRGYSTTSQRNVAVMLGQCGVMGNTCLVNRALIELALPFPDGLHVHDWWLGTLAELFGARSLIDIPLIDYRIHSSNASNSVTTLGGANRTTGIRRWWQRDFRLPFLEDKRCSALRGLLDGDGHRPALSEPDRTIVADFVACLEFQQPRWLTLTRLLRGGFLKRSLAHRLRVAATVAVTQRYMNKG